MGGTEATFVGKYIGGRYVVTAEVGAFDGTLAAVHEEAHGILRRSSAFGVILKSAEVCFAAGGVGQSSFALHALASGSRTSEEVHATYQSCRSGISYGANERVQALLDRHPSYQLYYKIGHELVGAEPLASIANAALEAICRFCWSAVELLKIEIPIVDLAVLRSIPPQALPDARFKRLRKVWGPDVLRAFVDEVLGEMKEPLREHFSQDPRTLADPAGEALRREISQGSLFLTAPDFDVAFNAQRNLLGMEQAMIEERMVERGYEVLARRYRGTDLEAISPEDLGPYLTRVSRALRSMPEVPEITLLRSRPTPIRRVATDEPTAANVVFFRKSESFTDTFDTSSLPFVLEPGHVVIYIPETRLEDLSASPGPIDMQVGANEAKDLDGLFCLLLPSRPMLVGIFASVLAEASEDAWFTLHMLARMDHQIWIIGDLPPRECVRIVRPAMPEMRGFWRSSKNPCVGALVCPQVGEAGFLEGMILMGSQRSMVGLARSVLIDELGDDFRGFGEALLLFESAHRRQRAGATLADWLLATECVLNK